MKIIIGLRKSATQGGRPSQFDMVRKGTGNTTVIRNKILTEIRKDPLGNIEGTNDPTYDFYIIDDTDNKGKIKTSVELDGEIVGVIDETTQIQFSRNEDGDIIISRVKPKNEEPFVSDVTNEEALPQETTVNQLKKIKKIVDKEIGGDIGDKISDMNKQGDNIQYIRNPIKTGIESYQDFERKNKKIFRFKDYKK